MKEMKSSSGGDAVSAAPPAMICAKCAGTEIRTRYHEGESYWGKGRTCAYGSAAYPTVHDSGEHLHRYCQTCGFEWIEKCADER